MTNIHFRRKLEQGLERASIITQDGIEHLSRLLKWNSFWKYHPIITLSNMTIDGLEKKSSKMYQAAHLRKSVTSEAAQLPKITQHN